MSSIITLFSVVLVYKVLGIVKQGIIKGIWESIEMVGRIVGWVVGIILLIVSLITILFIW